LTINQTVRGEYTFSEFKEYLASEGIEHQLRVVKTKWSSRVHESDTYKVCPQY